MKQIIQLYLEIHYDLVTNAQNLHSDTGTICMSTHIPPVCYIPVCTWFKCINYTPSPVFNTQYSILHTINYTPRCICCAGSSVELTTLLIMLRLFSLWSILLRLNLLQCANSWHSPSKPLRCLTPAFAIASRYSLITCDSPSTSLRLTPAIAIASRCDCEIHNSICKRTLSSIPLTFCALLLPFPSIIRPYCLCLGEARVDEAAGIGNVYVSWERHNMRS